MEKTGEINLITVARFQKSHGYERVIKGLTKYDFKSGNRIKVHFVGNGTELEHYKKLVKKYGLEESCVFYGEKYGEELEQIYSKADIGLGCFGFYKRKIYTSSALKTREYLMHGLPVVSGCREDIFARHHSKLFLEVPNDSSDVDISEIVSFYSALLSEYSKDTIRNMAMDYCREYADMSKTLKPVIDYLKN